MSRTAEREAGGSLDRVIAEAARLGLDAAPVRLEAGTRTAAEAAAACGCAVAQIVKSVVLRVAGSDRHVLFLTGGDARVDIDKASALVGAALEKACAASIRAATGFAIGGVSPLGHLRPIETYLDPRLLVHPVIWAAAGTPNHIFSVDPRALQAALRPVTADFTA